MTDVSAAKPLDRFLYKLCTNYLPKVGIDSCGRKNCINECCNSFSKQVQLCLITAYWVV